MPDRLDQLIDSYWNERTLSGRPQIDIDADLAASIETMHNLYAVTPPASSRERIRQRVLDLSDTAAKEYTMSVMTLPAELPATNGRVRPAVKIAKPKLVSTRMRPKWALASLAAALIILLGAIGGYLVLDNRNESSTPALVPAVQMDPSTDWPMYRGNPGRTGVMPGTGPKAMPSEVWRVQLDGSAFRSPIVVGETAYVGTAQGILYALDVATGKKKWQFQGDSALEMTPAYLDGVIYVPSLNGTLYAIDAATSEEKWQFAKPLAQFATPTFGNGLLIAASETDSQIYGIDPATGDEVWAYEAGSPVNRGQAWANGVLYSGSSGGVLYALNAADGAEIWQLDLQQDGVGTPAVANGVVYTTSPAGEVILVDAATGVERQRIPTDSTDGISPVAVADDMLYTGGWNASVIAIDLASGEVAWSSPTADTVRAAVALVDGVVYAVGLDNIVYAFDATTGEQHWSYELDGAMDFGPTVADGVVYASTDSGAVVALGDPANGTPVALASPVTTVEEQVIASLAVEVLWETGSGTESPLSLPQGVAVAPNGSVYVVNAGANTILIFTPDGVLSETWGEPGSGPGQFTFDHPDYETGNVAFDADGNIYVFDSVNCRVQKFAPDRSFLKEWGSPGSEDGQFDFLAWGTVDKASGRVYTTDYHNGRVQVFDLEGNLLDKWGTVGSGPGEFRGTASIAVDPDGNVYVSEEQGQRIQKFDSFGNLLDWTGPDGTIGSEAEVAVGMAFDSAGRLNIADWYGQRVEILDQNGTLIGIIKELPTGNAPLTGVMGVAFDPDDNLYLTDLDTNRLLKLQLPAESSTAASPVAVEPAQAEVMWAATGGDGGMSQPGHITIAPDGTIWVADNDNDRFQIFDAEGNFLETWGSTGSDDGQFDLTRANGNGYGRVRFASDGAFWVLDTGNHRLQQFGQDRAFIASIDMPPGDPDGLTEPIGFDIGLDGTLWVGDAPGVVRHYDTNGTRLASFVVTDQNGESVDSNGLAVDESGMLFVTDAPTPKVVMLSPDGTAIGELGGSDGTMSAFADQPMAIDFDQGLTYVIELFAEGNAPGTIQVFDGSGVHVQDIVVGGTQYGLAIAGDGTAYVSNPFDGILTKVQLPD